MSACSLKTKSIGTVHSRAEFLHSGSLIQSSRLDIPALTSGAQTIPQTNHSDHRLLPRAGHEPVCLVPAWDPSNACALLEFAEAPIHILRVSYSVDRYNYHQISCSGHRYFVLELVAGSDQCSDAYIGQLVSQPLRTAYLMCPL